MTTSISILIPTKDRQKQITRLLDSIRRSADLDRIYPEVIVGENGSADQTWDTLQKISTDFPVPLRLIRIDKPGKCKILNEAIRTAKGELLAFLDDDVIVDANWLVALANFFDQSTCLAAQGTIRIPQEELKDPQVVSLMQRFRTAHHLERDRHADNLNSLNGANMAIRREVFAKVGDFDIRLGPGAAGTSEDVELAQRMRRAGIKIGYMADAVVYHKVYRARLTEAYFKQLHQRQGVSRLVYKDQSAMRIFLDLCRSSLQYSYHSLCGDERNRYRNKGRMYHYGAMLKAKLGRHNPF